MKVQKTFRYFLYLDLFVAYFRIAGCTVWKHISAGAFFQQLFSIVYHGNFRDFFVEPKVASWLIKMSNLFKPDLMGNIRIQVR